MRTPKIFVCYTMRDGVLDRFILEAVNRALQPLGSVFIDLLHNTAGDIEAEWIRRLKNSDIMVVCWTPLVFESPWVLHEIHFASAARIPLFVIDGDAFRVRLNGGQVRQQLRLGVARTGYLGRLESV